MSNVSSSTSTEFMLTTVDNPYNPFTQFEEWLAFDTAHSYHTPAYLARVLISSDDLSEADDHFAIQIAIETIVDANITGLYRKVDRFFNAGSV